MSHMAQQLDAFDILEGDLVSWETTLGHGLGIVLKVIRTKDDLVGTPMEGVNFTFRGSSIADVIPNNHCHYVLEPSGDMKFLAGITIKLVSRAENAET